MDYTVSVEIGVTAKSPREAAEFALIDLRNKELGPWNLTVADLEGRSTSAWVGAPSEGSDERMIARLSTAHDGGNSRSLMVEAAVTGQGEAFREIRVSAFASDGRCIGNIVVGLNEQGELRALLTADGEGNSDHAIAVYPERPGPMAIEIIEDAEDISPTKGPRR